MSPVTRDSTRLIASTVAGGAEVATVEERPGRFVVTIYGGRLDGERFRFTGRRQAVTGHRGAVRLAVQAGG